MYQMPIAASPTVSPAPLTSRLFSRRHVIPSRTDVLYRIERGVVRTLTWSEAGTCIALGYWGQGVVLQKLFKDRAFVSISSRYPATPKIFDTNST
jgi:hypothetical protein